MEEKSVINTKEFENNAGTDNHVGVSDNIGKEMLESQKAKYEEEVEAYKEAVEQIDRDVENYLKQWNIDKRIMELQFDNFGKDEEQFSLKVHKIPEYWELEKEKYTYYMRQEAYKADKWFDQKNTEKMKATERIEIIEKNLEEVDTRLKDL